jgi:hypothetical protein
VVITHRFAGSVIALTDALTEWEAAGATREGEGAFTAAGSDSPVAGAGDTRLSGVVATIDGARPVPGARIILLDETGAVAAAADTDQAGRYVIESLPGGEYAAIISGYPPTASALHITRRAGTVRHDIWLGPARADHHSIDQQVAARTRAH